MTRRWYCKRKLDASHSWGQRAKLSGLTYWTYCWITKTGGVVNLLFQGKNVLQWPSLTSYFCKKLSSSGCKILFLQKFGWNSVAHASCIKPPAIKDLFCTVTMSQEISWQLPIAQITFQNCCSSCTLQGYRCAERTMTLPIGLWINKLKAVCN